MAWDPTKPAGNLPWNVADDHIRANNEALEDAVEREHEPLSDASTGGVHKQGSARAHVWTGATLDSSALNSNFNNPSSAKNTGKIVLDQPEGRIWICRDGAGGNWVELSEISGALNVLGLLTASNGLTVPTTKLVTGPTGENWLVNGAQQMNPLLHAARHAFGGQDAITGIIASNVIFKTATGSVVAAGTLNTHTYDFSSRAGNTLLIALGWGTINFDSVAIGHTCGLTAAIQLNGVDKGLVVDITEGPASAGNESHKTHFLSPAAFLVPNSAGQIIDWELKTFDGATSAGTTEVINYGLLILDLGTLGLTT